jgi:hypothetical protein
MTHRQTDWYDTYGPPEGPPAKRVVTSQSGLWHWIRPSTEPHQERYLRWSGRVIALCGRVEPVSEPIEGRVRWCIKCRGHALSPLPAIPTKRRHDD